MLELQKTTPRWQTPVASRYEHIAEGKPMGVFGPQERIEEVRDFALDGWAEQPLEPGQSRVLPRPQERSIYARQVALGSGTVLWQRLDEAECVLARASGNQPLAAHVRQFPSLENKGTLVIEGTFTGSTPVQTIRKDGSCELLVKAMGDYPRASLTVARDHRSVSGYLGHPDLPIQDADISPDGSRIRAYGADGRSEVFRLLIPLADLKG